MNKSPNSKESTDQKGKPELFNGLWKSVAGLVAVLVLLVGLGLLLVFQPDISSGLKSDSPEQASESSTNQTEANRQIVDGKDLETGLIAGEGLELVKGNCTNCHSSALIIQNHFTREVWKEKIVWMQETQGLWDLGASEPKILDYLAENYAPEAPKGRRIPLSGIEWYELKE